MIKIPILFFIKYINPTKYWKLKKILDVRKKKRNGKNINLNICKEARFNKICLKGLIYSSKFILILVILEKHNTLGSLTVIKRAQ